MFYLKFIKKKLNVLLSGCGCKEVAIAHAISKSPYLNKLYYWGKNKAIDEYAEHIGNKPTPEISKFLKEKKIDLLICQSEGELSIGTFDIFRYYYGVPTFGITKKWTKLESSKHFAKQFMERNCILTPDYTIIDSVKEYLKIADEFGFPVVIKQNSFFRGFGTFIANNKEDAIKIIEKNLQVGYFDRENKSEKNRLLIEKYIVGKEISQMLLWDGKTLVPLCPIRDYKKAFDNNEGFNTGGLGAIAPVSLTAEEQQQRNEYIKKLEKALKKEKATDFTGVIYAGLMFSQNKLYTLEYNIRFGDPEIQVFLEHLESDFLEVLYLVSRKKAHKIKLKYKEGHSMGVILCTEEYLYSQNIVESKIKVPKDKSDVVTFHYSYLDKKDDIIIFSNLGRPIILCCNSIDNPQQFIYKEIEKFKALNDNLYYRADIGSDVLEQEKD